MNLQEARNLKNAVSGPDRTLFAQIYFSNIFQLKQFFYKKKCHARFFIAAQCRKNGGVAKVSAFANEPFRRYGGHFEFYCFNI